MDNRRGASDLGRGGCGPLRRVAASLVNRDRGAAVCARPGGTRPSADVPAIGLPMDTETNESNCFLSKLSHLRRWGSDPCLTRGRVCYNLSHETNEFLAAALIGVGQVIPPRGAGWVRGAVGPAPTSRRRTAEGVHRRLHHEQRKPRPSGSRRSWRGKVDRGNVQRDRDRRAVGRSRPVIGRSQSRDDRDGRRESRGAPRRSSVDERAKPGAAAGAGRAGERTVEGASSARSFRCRRRRSSSRSRRRKSRCRAGPGDARLSASTSPHESDLRSG